MKSYLRILLSLTSFVVCIGMLVYFWSDDIIVRTDNRRALERCAEEGMKGCPLLFQYTARLERENEILRLQVRECNVLIPETSPESSEQD